MKINVSLLILTTILVAELYAKGSINLRVQKITCEVIDPKTVKLDICTVKAVNRSTTLINVGGDYIRSVDTFLIHSQLYKKSEIKYRPFLVNVVDDYCEFMGKKKGGTYLKIVAPIYMPYTNMNHTCPYFGHHWVKDLPIDEDKIPAIWPAGSYLLGIEFLEANDNKLLTTNIYFEIKQRSLF